MSLLCPSTDERQQAAVALYVDLDGALLATDTLWESLLELARRRPLDLFALPFWLLRGKAAFKHELARRVLPEVATLPVRDEVLRLLHERQAAGQQLVLATGADERIARAFAERFPIFTDILASDGAHNLTGRAKLRAIVTHAGDNAFDYLGDSSADACLWSECRVGYVAGDRPHAWRIAQHARGSADALVRLRPPAATLRALFAALRPHQWAKNLLVGVPLLVSHQFTQPAKIAATLLAFLAFSLAASAVYVANDLLDLPSDRAHPVKRRRPLASGALSIPAGLLLALALLAGGFALAFGAVGTAFGGVVAVYVLTNALYSAALKRKLLLDVFVLAGLFTLRILAGSVAIGVEPSKWLLAFSLFVFTSLAMLKRCAELKTWSRLAQKWPAGRGYAVSDIELLRSAGLAAAGAAVLVFALYISSSDVALLYRRPGVLWLVCPLLLYWLTRLWFLTNRSNPLDDPVLFALTDRASLACGAMVILLLVLAT